MSKWPMLPPFAIRSTTRTLKLPATETRRWTGEMESKKIYRKCCRCKKYMKMHHMAPLLRRLTSTNSLLTRPKMTSSKSSSKEESYKSATSNVKFNNQTLPPISLISWLRNVCTPLPSADSPTKTFVRPSRIFILQSRLISLQRNRLLSVLNCCKKDTK